jgi:hypothetical protein
MVELLVVFSLLALLLVLLMPALRHARSRAQALTCASNLRQIGVGMSLYATQQNNYFPPMEILAGGLRTFPDRLDAAGVLDGAVSTHQRSIFFCPEYDLTIYDNQYSQFRVTYSSHTLVVGYLDSTGWIYPAVKRSHMRNPERVMLVSDGVYQLASPGWGHHIYPNVSAGYEIGKYHVVPQRYDPGQWVRYAHLESPQAVFVDGHVEQHPGPWGPLTPP